MTFICRKGPTSYEFQIGRLWLRYCYLRDGGWRGAPFWERVEWGWERDED